MIEIVKMVATGGIAGEQSKNWVEELVDKDNREDWRRAAEECFQIHSHHLPWIKSA